MNRRPGRLRIAALLLALTGILSAPGCARQGAPTGGAEDRRPPLVIRVEPDTFATVPAGLDELRVEFNERISERSSSGSLADAVIISPEVPELEVGHDRSGLEIKVPGGLQAGRVYTIRILPEVQDMFGNRMAVPFEWSISTGGVFTQNAVVGQIWDRATGDFLQGVRVVVTPEAGEDDANYAVVSAEEGLYALRVLPPGSFSILAYQDVNRNRELDGTEPLGTARDSLGPADTLFLSLPVLLPDTTAAVLAEAELLDSTVVRLRFDDFLDPTVPVDTVLVWLDPDTAAVAQDTLGGPPPPEVAENELPAPLRLFHEFEWSAFRDSIQLARDSLLLEAVEEARAAGDTVLADSLTRAGIEPLPGGTQGATITGVAEALPDGTPPPQPSFVVLFDRPFPAGAPLLIHSFGAVNLNGLSAGEGAAGIIWTPAPVDSLQADSTVVGDSVAVPDTGRVVPAILR